MDSKSNDKLSTGKSHSKKTNHRQRQDSLNSRRTSTDSESENDRRQSTAAEVENNDLQSQQSTSAASENKKNRRARFSLPDESAIASTSSPPPPLTATIAPHKEPRKSILKNSNTISPDYISPPPAPDHDDEDVPIDNRFARHVDSMIVTNLRRAKDKDKKDHSKE